MVDYPGGWRRSLARRSARPLWGFSLRQATCQNTPHRLGPTGAIRGQMHDSQKRLHKIGRFCRLSGSRLGGHGNRARWMALVCPHEGDGWHFGVPEPKTKVSDYELFVPIPQGGDRHCRATQLVSSTPTNTYGLAKQAAPRGGKPSDFCDPHHLACVLYFGCCLRGLG